MIYKTKERRLYINDAFYIKLSEEEHRLLICLSSGDFVTYKEILNFLHINNSNFRRLKHRFCQKTKYILHVKTKKNEGLILKEKIYFE